FNPIQKGGLAGKGVGNLALIMNQGDTHPPRIHYLVLHETGHCLYGVHAFNEASGKKDDFHITDQFKYTCIMSAPNDLHRPLPERPDEKSHPDLSKKKLAKAQDDWDKEKKKRDENVFSMGTFCGKCNAGLRGVWVMQDPLHKGKSFVGNAALARNPNLGTATGGVAVPDGEVDPHMVPLPEDDFDVDL